MGYYKQAQKSSAQITEPLHFGIKSTCDVAFPSVCYKYVLLIKKSLWPIAGQVIARLEGKYKE